MKKYIVLTLFVLLVFFFFCQPDPFFGLFGGKNKENSKAEAPKKTAGFSPPVYMGGPPVIDTNSETDNDKDTTVPVSTAAKDSASTASIAVLVTKFVDEPVSSMDDLPGSLGVLDYSTAADNYDFASLTSGLHYNGFIWPVKKSTINCYFHDPRSPYRRLLGEHQAIDIAAVQGTPLHAAADGYVSEVKFDGSRDYAYIIIMHANGLSTVYGHVSAAYVKAKDYVVQGQVIGRSGGAPGSIGSGYYTTGPHLHFGMLANGIPVNPLNYLP